MSNILAIDTALDSCSVAVRAGDRVNARTELMGRGQSERLVPMIDEIMAQAGLQYQDLDAIGVTVGPGAFTGLRIGLSTARALGLALNRPVAGISTFDVLLRQFGSDAAVVLETKRTDFYVWLEGRAEVMTGDDIRKVLKDKKVTLIGDGLSRLETEFGFDPAWIAHKEISHPDPAVLATITAELLVKKGKNLPAPEPVYLRGADVSQSKRVSRRIAGE